MARPEEEAFLAEMSKESKPSGTKSAQDRLKAAMAYKAARSAKPVEETCSEGVVGQGSGEGSAGQGARDGGPAGGPAGFLDGVLGAQAQAEATAKDPRRLELEEKMRCVSAQVAETPHDLGLHHPGLTTRKGHKRERAPSPPTPAGPAPSAWSSTRCSWRSCGGRPRQWSLFPLTKTTPPPRAALHRTISPRWPRGACSLVPRTSATHSGVAGTCRPGEGPVIRARLAHEEETPVTCDAMFKRDIGSSLGTNQAMVLMAH